MEQAPEQRLFGLDVPDLVCAAAVDQRWDDQRQNSARLPHVFCAEQQEKSLAPVLTQTMAMLRLAGAAIAVDNAYFSPLNTLLAHASEAASPCARAKSGTGSADAGD